MVARRNAWCRFDGSIVGVAVCFALAALAGCSEGGSSVEDGARRTQQALHGFGEDPEPDIAYPGVVRLGGCTGTLIAPRVVMTAAHCESQLGNGCTTVQDRVESAEHPKVWILPSGESSTTKMPTTSPASR